MSNTKKIFIDELDNFVGDVTINLVPVAGKKNKFTAVVNLTATPADTINVMAETGLDKVFTGIESAVKFIGKYSDPDTELTVSMDYGIYAVREASGDPTKAAIKQIAYMTKRVAVLVASSAKVTTQISSAAALGWDTGTSAQQAAYAEYQARKVLIDAANVALQAKLDALIAAQA